MHRFMVMEAFADGDKVRMQVLALHASITGAYFYWDIRAQSQLYLIDCQTKKVADWKTAFELMCVENLRKLTQDRRIPLPAQAALLEMKYIDSVGIISGAGQALLDRYYKPPPLIIKLGFIKSDTRLRLTE